MVPRSVRDPGIPSGLESAEGRAIQSMTLEGKNGGDGYVVITYTVD
jgi:hypothetical protein